MLWWGPEHQRKNPFGLYTRSNITTDRMQNLESIFRSEQELLLGDQYKYPDMTPAPLQLLHQVVVIYIPALTEAPLLGKKGQREGGKRKCHHLHDRMEKCLLLDSCFHCSVSFIMAAADTPLICQIQCRSTSPVKTFSWYTTGNSILKLKFSAHKRLWWSQTYKRCKK